ncbi:hypothetical protein [Vulcanisaeta sp. JCM 16159]|uniref:hypothetical protein n=1 Tax=Vulcanisaeta sp. JCM 16159 TaxID=1295371 RepID=UPI001FB3102A|nr:hypothetical protein [Vulcanisaeta sp. JCM 16159]
MRKIMITALMRNALSNSAVRSRLLVINMAPLYYVSQLAAVIFTLTFLEVLSSLLSNSLIIVDELIEFSIGMWLVSRLLRG